MTSIVSTLQNIWEKNWPEVHAAATGGLPQFIFTRRPRDLESGVPVFCYHLVSTEEFEADLNFLSRNNYITIDADTLLDHLEEHRRALQRAVVLTIDDGARNLFEVAFPLLKRYSMTAVAFVRNSKISPTSLSSRLQICNLLSCFCNVHMILICT